MVAADPHLASYGNARVDVDLPCTYRLTRFLTDHRNKDTPFAYCSLEVAGTNVLSHGRYYVGSVHISVGIVDSGSQVKDVYEVHKYGTTDDKVFKYLANMNHTRILWGSSVHDKIKGVSVYPTFDSEDNFSVLNVPQCEMRVKYRAFSPDSRRQPLMPGISIMAPGDSQFVPGYGEYPNSLCGLFTDTELLYDDRATALGVKNRRLAIIYDVLDKAPEQMGNKQAGECRAAFKAFGAATQKVDDLNFCGDILTDARTRRCILASREKYQPITVFTACIRFRQNGASADCQVMKNAKDQCGKDWKGPDISCGP